MVDDTDKLDQNSQFVENKKVAGNEVKQKRGIFYRIWKGIFRGREDFEKKLQHLSKEEATVQARINRRARSWRRAARNIVSLSVILEVVAVIYAVISTRTSELNWKTRGVRVLPMFLVPLLSYTIYSTLSNFTRMRNHKDQKTLERLRAERQAKIHELKERTNYYTTQQLIQKYDDDPAAKAAAASVLAQKLGEESGVKVYLSHEHENIHAAGKSNDVQITQHGELRNRKHGSSGVSSVGNVEMAQNLEPMGAEPGPEAELTSNQPVVVGHYKQPSSNEGGWIARLAALLVGEDPTHCFALICGNCFMHNGLARKEDFPYIRYYCPHCHALNGPQHDGSASISTASSKKASPRPSSADSDTPITTHSLLESEVTSVSKAASDDSS